MLLRLSGFLETAKPNTSPLRRASLADLKPLIEAGVGGAGLAVAPARARISVSRDGLVEPDPDSDAVAFIVPVRVGSTVSSEVSDLSKRRATATSLICWRSASLIRTVGHCVPARRAGWALSSRTS